MSKNTGNFQKKVQYVQILIDWQVCLNCNLMRTAITFERHE